MEENKKIKIEKMNGIKAKVDKWITIEDALFNCPIGSKVILKNKDVVIKYCYNVFIDNRKHTRVYVEGILDEVKEIQIPEYTKVVKLKREILDKQEKEYLRNVIKPFRKNNDITIMKNSCMDWSERERNYIMIFIGDENIDFPYLESEDMYAGMELTKRYTLEELGL